VCAIKRPGVIAWVCLFVLLTIASITAWYVERRLAAEHDQRLFELGHDIAQNREKWEDITLGEKSAFMWWKNLSVGHGLTMDVVTIKQVLSTALLLQLAITLALVHRRNRDAGTQASAANDETAVAKPQRSVHTE